MKKRSELQMIALNFEVMISATDSNVMALFDALKGSNKTIDIFAYRTASLKALSAAC